MPGDRRRAHDLELVHRFAGVEHPLHEGLGLLGDHRDDVAHAKAHQLLRLPADTFGPGSIGANAAQVTVKQREADRTPIHESIEQIAGGIPLRGDPTLLRQVDADADALARGIEKER
jgi:hypothetical protein